MVDLLANALLLYSTSSDLFRGIRSLTMVPECWARFILSSFEVGEEGYKQGWNKALSETVHVGVQRERLPSVLWCLTCYLIAPCTAILSSVKESVV